MTSTRNFWPLDYDPEEEIYENLSWDLPGFKPAHRSRRVVVRQRRSAGAKLRQPFCKPPHTW
jgi:hypothetical protein